MKILLLAPYYGGSHKQWADELKYFSSHDVDIINMPGRFWKWRMHGAAITMAEEYNELDSDYELILTTDMLDVSTFLSLIKERIPLAVYFHENQLSYPFSPHDTDKIAGRDNHYAFINYTSALAADRVFFNSNFHYRSFISNLELYLDQFPDYKNLYTIEKIQAKSEVLPIGIHVSRLMKYKKKYEIIDKSILWNHRWEYDKNPELFFNTLFRLKEEGIDFKLIVVGKKYLRYPEIFDQAKELLKDEIIQFGYCETEEQYIKYLWQSSIIPVTSKQDFFGISAIEAMFCSTIPILPNRLAFPEHLNESWQRKLYYSDDEAFYSTLKSALLAKITIDLDELREDLSKYEWQRCKIQYDEAFENIIFA